MAVPSQLVSEPKRTEGGTGMTNFKVVQKYKNFIRKNVGRACISFYSVFEIFFIEVGGRES